MARDPERNFIWWCAAASVSLITLAVLFGTIAAPRPDTIQFELRKLLIQFLVVTALGAVLALLVDRVKRRLDQAELERQYTAQAVGSLLDRLDGIYRHVKLTRRLMRLTPLDDLTMASYTDRLLALNSDQQDLEQLRDNISAYAPRIPKLDLLLPHVGKMEKYIGKLWTERERLAPTATGALRSEAPRISAFVAHATTDPNSDFQLFSEPYRTARSSLVDLLGERFLVPPRFAAATPPDHR
jgi:hypothetical protein